MIELIPDLPANIIGVKATGQVTKEDYQNVLIPAFKDALEKNDKLKVLYVAGEDFNGMDFGAMWEDFTFGVGHYNNWQKIAVVTDVAWMANTINAFRFMMPCPVKVFPNAANNDAKSWIMAD